MRLRFADVSILLASALLLSACGTATASTTNKTETREVQTEFECPVTIPSQPRYGSDELWTVLAIDGDHGRRKSVWWSSKFAGGLAEQQPDVWVTWTRLDADEPLVIDNEGIATNAFTPEDGWFMIAGIDPAERGCWQVEATYKNNTLSYVYQT